MRIGALAHAPQLHRAPTFDIRRLIEQEHVLAHFQPLVSLKRRAVVGVEGLSRGWVAETQTTIAAPRLFAEAAAQGFSRELDLLCRRKILCGFRSLLDQHAHLVLSLNMEPSAIDKRLWTGHLITQVADAGLSARNIVLEIVESAVRDEGELRRWVQSYREAGYLIALDDVGAGHSNLNRIAELQPDILKVDRYLVRGIDQDFHRREVYRSLASMAHRLGAMIIAEGVETEEEALTLLEMRADVVQGFLLAVPRQLHELRLESLPERLDELGARHRARQMQQVGAKRASMRVLLAVADEVLDALARSHRDDFDSVLTDIAQRLSGVECLYVLDDSGIQVTSMVVTCARKASRQSDLFRPQPRGADHSMHDYYYMLRQGDLNKPTYVTGPYLSLVTGRRCVTIGALARDLTGRRYFLCLDVQGDLGADGIASA
jgi:EAL domain-containing protein (putative c-di-GMP-specific phosphodiesterase class I)